MVPHKKAKVMTDRSRNGTYLDDEKLNESESVYINDGDRLRLGRTYFIFQTV